MLFSSSLLLLCCLVLLLSCPSLALLFSLSCQLFTVTLQLEVKEVFVFLFSFPCIVSYSLPFCLSVYHEGRSILVFLSIFPVVLLFSSPSFLFFLFYLSSFTCKVHKHQAQLRIWKYDTWPGSQPCSQSCISERQSMTPPPHLSTGSYVEGDPRARVGLLLQPVPEPRPGPAHPKAPEGVPAHRGIQGGPQHTGESLALPKLSQIVG